MNGLRISFFGSSLVSAYWNGAATYYRGIIRGLHRLGHRVTFYEPDAFDRQAHRDIDPPGYARSVVYPPTEPGVQGALDDAAGSDIVVKASGVGVFDDLLEERVLEFKSSSCKVVFWDVDAPATLERVRADWADYFGPLIPRYDLILTYGGGEPVSRAYRSLGAVECVPVYNGLDPDVHQPEEPDQRFTGSLGFLGNRLPDRESRVAEFFLKPAGSLPGHRFLIGGNGWDAGEINLPNVELLGHVYTRDHNKFNSTLRMVLNINRESMARFGYSPATRLFEAAGAGACLITDYWEGVELFLEPGRECLVARTGDEVVDILREITPRRAAEIGRAALKRVRRDHTYDQRARQVEPVLMGLLSQGVAS
jgi:spore maturation protein CgeB